MLHPAGLLKNTATGRYHPIVFRMAPMPSGADGDMPARRYRSSGHHTEGFESKEAAEAYIAEFPEWTYTKLMWEWNGEGIPALTAFFPNSNYVN